MAHEYAKEAKALHDKKLKSYGEGTKNEPKNFAGFPALNTDQQAGRAPLNSEKYIPPEVTRVERKKGGAVKGAASLKRLDKAPRGKVPTGARKGPVPSATSQQVEFDPTVNFAPGEMNPRSVRAKGGKMSHIEWEHSKKDLSEDRKLARKYKMPLEKWEESKLDEKHDKQQSMKGLCWGGKAKKDGGRAKRAEGGMLGDGSDDKKMATKGKTTVNIMVGNPQGMEGARPVPPVAGNMPPIAPPAPPMAPPMGGAPGMPPMAAPPMAPPMGGMPPMGAAPGGPPMPRKDGGKVQVPYKKPGRKGEYPAMDFGAGGGFGRKQKIDAYGTKGPSSKDNY